MKEIHFTPQEKLLRLPQVLELIPIARSTLWLWVKQNRMPAPIKLNGSRSTFWRYSEIVEYISRQGVMNQGGTNEPS